MLQFQLFHGSGLPRVTPEYEAPLFRLALVKDQHMVHEGPGPTQSPLLRGQTPAHHKNINSFFNCDSCNIDAL